MAKILVIQHVPSEPLGTLDPLIRAKKHRIRYINFSRTRLCHVNVSEYDGLILLGGPMNVSDAEQYPFIQTELKLIEQAIAHQRPILGICLGAQMIAHVLGGRVYPAQEKELGWYQLHPTLQGEQDALIQTWGGPQTVFQWHGHTYDAPETTTRLVTGSPCINQAFRYGKNVYGFQFHLEVTAPLIERWRHSGLYLDNTDNPQAHIEQVHADTQKYIGQSEQLSQRVFSAFLANLPSVKRRVVFTSR